MKKASFQTYFKPLSGTRTKTYFISLSLYFNADSISVNILNYTMRNREIWYKMLGRGSVGPTGHCDWMNTWILHHL